jgi:hypothetical protein
VVAQNFRFDPHRDPTADLHDRAACAAVAPPDRFYLVKTRLLLFRKRECRSVLDAFGGAGAALSRPEQLDELFNGEPH